jgi:hypothetical protein
MQIRTNHHYGFRNGQWATLLGVVMYRGRAQYAVIFEDDAVMDLWPVEDPDGEYEIREG